MRDVVKRHPEALYLILGETHPVVRRHEGESYRESLQETRASSGLQNNVQLIDHYLDFDELVSYLQATDIYLTPYLNPVQIVSGTLAYAVGCGKAIVSTPYLYAEELLAHGRGFLCRIPRRALDRRTRQRAARRSVAAPRDRAPRLSLRPADDVAARRAEYGRLFAELGAAAARRAFVDLRVERRWHEPIPPLDHLADADRRCRHDSARASNVPNRSTGYCTDDVARALIVAVMRLAAASRTTRRRQRLAATYLAFLLRRAAWPTAGFTTSWATTGAGSTTSARTTAVGRAMWALGLRDAVCAA